MRNYAVVTCWTILVIAGCRPSLDTNSPGVFGQSNEALSNHERMVIELEAVADRAAFENPYLGRAAITQLQSELQFSAESPTFPVASRVSLLTALGFHKLRVGENTAALADLNAAYTLWTRHSGEIPDQIADKLLMMLSIAHLRVAETENCVFCETGQNCIFPIQESSIHAKPSGSQKAQHYLQELIERNPDDLSARWLLNITAMTLGKHP